MASRLALYILTACLFLTITHCYGVVAQSKKLVEALHTADVDVELHVADEAALGSEATLPK